MYIQVVLSLYIFIYTHIHTYICTYVLYIYTYIYIYIYASIAGPRYVGKALSGRSDDQIGREIEVLVAGGHLAVLSMSIRKTSD